LSFDELIPKYDNEYSFFYCDPPYSKGTGYKTCSTAKFKHEELKEILSNIKGKFILSYDDSEKIRKLYKDFDIIPVSRRNGINGRKAIITEYKEVIIKNYDDTS